MRKRLTPSLVISCLALFIALGSAGYAANGGNFILGQANTATNQTQLSSTNASMPTLYVANTGGRPAARFQANGGKAPFTVSNSTKIANLNADNLDGLDSSAFLPSGGKAADSDLLDGFDSSGFYAAGSKVADSDKLDGLDSTALMGAGYQVVSASIGLGNTQSVQGTLLCPSGKKAVGGGWDNDANSGFGTGMTITRSAPTADGGGWTGAMKNDSGATVNVTLYVVCITATGASSSALSRSATPPPKLTLSER